MAIVDLGWPVGMFFFFFCGGQNFAKNIYITYIVIYKLNMLQIVVNVEN